jgi:hypothetical protein
VAFGSESVSFEGEQRVGGGHDQAGRVGVVGEDAGQGAHEGRANLVREQGRGAQSPGQLMPFEGDEGVDGRHQRPGRGGEVHEDPQDGRDQDPASLGRKRLARPRAVGIGVIKALSRGCRRKRPDRREIGSGGRPSVGTGEARRFKRGGSRHAEGLAAVRVAIHVRLRDITSLAHCRPHDRPNRRNPQVNRPDDFSGGDR